MLSRETPLIVSIGEVLWDILPSNKQLGGAPLNLVYHSVKNGAKGAIISAVGDDDLGKEAISLISKTSITMLIETCLKPTGKVIVELKEGIPSYDIKEDVAFDNISTISDKILKTLKVADAVAFGTLALRREVSRETIKKMLSKVSDDTLKFFDINLRGNYYSLNLIKELLLISDILKINDDELQIIRDMFDINGDEDAVCLYLKEKYNLKYVILTAGASHSAIYYDDEKISKINTPKVKVADTVGAGDAFSGTFLSCILQGEDVIKSHEKSVIRASEVCTRYGAW